MVAKRKIWQEALEKIHENVKGRVGEYSSHKYASNVIEKCVRGKEWRLVKIIVEELVSN